MTDTAEKTVTALLARARELESQALMLRNTSPFASDEVKAQKCLVQARQLRDLAAREG